jgi:nicotinamide-nucleotide amidase
METALGEVLKALMVGKHLTLAVAESLTAGTLQAAVGSISGASTFFEGGVTAYSLEHKVRLLMVDREHAERVNSVSQRVAFELARGACDLFRSSIGIGTTGYAEPSPDDGIDVPMAYFAICRRAASDVDDVTGGQLFGAGLSRVRMQKYVTKSVLEILVSYLKTC